MADKKETATPVVTEAKTPEGWVKVTKQVDGVTHYNTVNSNILHVYEQAGWIVVATRVK